MSRYLLISVRLLDDRFHGRGDEGRTAEWPPSPMRLFQALVAGAKSRWTDTAARAFHWLESLTPPSILAPNVRTGRVLLTYVPNNNDPPGNERTAKWIRPTILSGDRLIQYGWPLGEESDSATEYAQIIAAIASRIRAFGWGVDLAIGHGEVVDGMPESDGKRLFYQPSTAGAGIRMRAPTRGSLASLERAYVGSLNRFAKAGEFVMESAEKAFVTVPYASSPRRPFCAFSLVRNEDEPAAYRPVHIKQLAGALRRLAAHSLRGFVSEDRIDGMIMGHPQDAPRVSILTLPSIGHQHSDGLIRRVAFVEPADRDGALSAIIRRVLHGKTIAFEGACDCAPAELERIEVDGVISRYSDESRSWASVTPVLLPGHNQRRQDRSNHAKNLQRAHRLVCKSLQQAGINVGAHVEIDTVPYWQGALHAREYNPRDKLAHFPRFHVKLEFERPVCGPLSIGAGRHVGFGVLAACDHEES